MSLTIQSNLPALEQLPENFAIALTNFSAISLSGEEKSKYLQGQVTCDVNELAKKGLLHGGHCDAKGKVLSIFRLINREDAHLLMQTQASLDVSIKELKKFGVFAKVSIAQTQELTFAALVGNGLAENLKAHFGCTPDSLSPVIQAGSTTLVYLAGNIARYIVIDEANKVEQHLSEINLPIFNEKIWDLLEITEGFPVLSNESVNEYVPQMLNVDAIHGISFTKGCYLGQETVARMQYLGKNKKAMVLLTGKSALPAGSLPKIAAELKLEKQLGENWRSAGDTLSYYQSDAGDIYIQAVVAKDLEHNTNIKISGHDNERLTLSDLPYITFNTES